MQRLPVHEALPALRRALGATASAVLVAPPGAGKTTVVPLELLGESWLEGGRIVMLEPRRLAARAAARRMASTLGQQIGETVGYRVRFDTRVGRNTRIEVVTEGILTRRLQSDPGLEGVALVIFDEFHERSLNADLGLALMLHARSLLRPELRMLVMSATIDAEPVARLLGGAPVIITEGRVYPVETRYVAPRPDARLEATVAAAVRMALAQDEGDSLVFLPGAGEIRRTEERLVADGVPPGVRVMPLYGDLPPDAQDEAIAPSGPGRRKVVLATSIAETSLTIEGVRVVIDAGLSRVPRFSARTGMTSLETVRVSIAAADQRRGRAGRLGPGVCYRLWAEHEQHHLVPHRTPEIVEADLAPLALDLEAFGVHDPSELDWLDPPPNAAYSQARELLAELGAIDAGGRLTSHGRRLAGLPLHPRLAHMVVRAEALGLGGMACDLSILLGGRDPLRGSWADGAGADVGLRLEAVRGPLGARLRDDSAALRRQLAIPVGRVDVSQAGVLLAFAYPDRIGQRRPGGGGRFLLRGGSGAAFAPGDPLTQSAYVVAAELDGRRPESRVFLGAPISLEEIEEHFGDQILEESVVEWDDALRSVLARRRQRLGAIVLAEGALSDPDPTRVAEVLLDALEKRGVEALPWGERGARLRERLRFMHRVDGSWPDVSEAPLGARMREWLLPHLTGFSRMTEVERIDLAGLVLGMLTWEQRAALDAAAPTHVVVPSGSRVPIDYSDPAAPVLAVRLQEMFGLAETPRIAGGRVPLTLHLLSPARRPVQVTRDLAGFWRSTYFDVRKDLKGRYPKHHWPDDPMAAEPTGRAKRRGE